MTENFLQFGETGAAVHERAAIGADRNEIAQVIGKRFVFDHAPRWRSGRAAFNAIEFAGFAWALIFNPFLLQKVPQLAAQHKYWPTVVALRKSLFDPGSYCISVDVK